MTEPAYTRAAADTLTAAARAEHDFPGWLAVTLATAAARLGSSYALVAGRPGSWEADLVLRLVQGTVGWDDEYLPAAEPETAPATLAAPDGTVTLSPADRLTVLGALWDAAEYRANHADDSDRRLITAYRALSRSLGDDHD